MKMKSFHVSLSLCVSVLLKALRMFVCVYELCNSPPRSYRQPDGNGHLLSRRYCTRSVWLFSCDQNTARESQGAMAVSCKYLSTSRWPSNQLDHNDLFSHANSNVDIADISSILNFFFKSPSRDDLLINFLVSVFTPCKNFTSVWFNLGSTRVKQISSLFTIKSHSTDLELFFLFLLKNKPATTTRRKRKRKRTSANARIFDERRLKKICYFFLRMWDVISRRRDPLKTTASSKEGKDGQKKFKKGSSFLLSKLTKSFTRPQKHSRGTERTIKMDGTRFLSFFLCSFTQFLSLSLSFNDILSPLFCVSMFAMRALVHFWIYFPYRGDSSLRFLFIAFIKTRTSQKARCTTSTRTKV